MVPCAPPLLASKIAALPRKHDNSYPLWQGPCGPGWNGGITQSMLCRFLSCRERFRLHYILGLEPHDKWNHRLGYGSMWHKCEEALASGKDHGGVLQEYGTRLLEEYPLQREEIVKWWNVCLIQFPVYTTHWAQHPDVKNRTPLLQEEAFDVPYNLPSGRVVRLRGRWDSVDLIDGGIYLAENKTKGDVDKAQIERQLKFDLQSMTYLTALIAWQQMDDYGTPVRTPEVVSTPVQGVRYNVVRRPLSGGRGTIRQCKGETEEQYYERLRTDYINAEPEHYFFRVRAEVSLKDIEVFRTTCLDPLLETLCWWYNEVTGREGNSSEIYGYPPTNYRTPFGVYSALEEGGATEYDHYLETGSEVGLRRVEELFLELK